MRTIGVREFRDQATALLASDETLIIDRHGDPIGFYVPIAAKDRAAGRAALGRLGSLVNAVIAEAGVDVDELVKEITPRCDVATMTVIDAAVYSPLESEARARSLRDSRHWPVVATALVLGASIWTHPNDFLCTGVATWTTDSLQAWMERNTTER